MITIEPDETDLMLFDAVADSGTTKGGPSLKDSLPGLVGIHNPYVLEITPDNAKDDPELVKFLQANAAEARFFVLHTTCTFYPRAGEPFQKAWLNINLARADGLEDAAPVVWSMQPQRLASEVNVKTTIKLDASLKFQDIGANSGVSKELSEKVEKPYLEAFLFDSTPFWEFNANERFPLRGSYPLSMVVRVPSTNPCCGKVTLRATVQRKNLGIIPYTTDFPDAPQIQVKFN